MRVPTPSALTVTALLASTLVSAPLLSGSASAADLTTCQGKAVTQVITSGPATTTPGDDVVVVDVPAGGSGFSLSTGDGNDTVCVYGTGTMIIGTGTGSDSVDLTTAGPTTSPTQVTLGLGDDRLVGGSSGEIVTDSGGGLLGTPVAPGIDDDTITTGGGDDVVSSERGSDVISTGAGNDRVPLLAGPEADRVDLGDGDDAVSPSTTRSTSLLGGAGTDTLTVISGDGTDDIDTAAQTITLSGGTATFDSFETYVVEVRRDFSFRGSERPERFVALAALPGSGPATGLHRLGVDLAGGDDELAVDQTMTGLWRGGPGTDLLATDRNAEKASRGRQPGLVVDLLRGRYTAKGTTPASIGAFEAVSTTRFSRVSVFGSKRADRVTLSTCRAYVAGRGGDDVIDVDHDRCGVTRRSSTLQGGAGADAITGGAGADTMYGGTGADVLRGRGGRDTAFGGPGRDRCTAERRVSC